MSQVTNLIPLSRFYTEPCSCGQSLCTITRVSVRSEGIPSVQLYEYHASSKGEARAFITLTSIGLDEDTVLNLLAEDAPEERGWGT